MRKIIVISLLFIVCISSKLKAQISENEATSYTNAIGIKFYPTGITFKHFLDSKNAVEGIGYFYNRGTRITALYEIHNDIPSLDGLKWYVGPGAHIGYLDNKYGNGGLTLGLDGVAGLDYKFSDVPFNISLDLQPSFEMAKYYGDNRVTIWGGVGVRYTF